MSKKDKLSRVQAALTHREYDRVPVSDFFWTGFTKSAKKLWGNDCDLYRKFDLDYIVINPNMDPIIKDFDVISQNGDDIVLKTGFGATVRRRADLPMPYFEDFSVKNPEDMAKFVIEPANDKRRLFKAGQDQLNCLGDQLVGSLPSWNDRVDSYVEDFPIFGSVTDGFEYLWRCVGTENALLWMLTDEELFADFVGRIGDFMAELARIQAADDRLSGLYIWGDVAYVHSMMFSPVLWRKYFKPIVKRIIDICKEAGLMTIYHGCGDVTGIFDDFVKIGLQGYNPLEAKAGLDAVKLKEKYANKLAAVGNIDIRALESGDNDIIAAEVLYKLKAGVGGGLIVQSDHSVSSPVKPESYEYMISLLREYGTYPLDLDKINHKLSEVSKS